VNFYARIIQAIAPFVYKVHTQGMPKRYPPLSPEEVRIKLIVTIDE
jgi:hypothetical protein